MTIDEVREFVESLGGVLVLAPGPGDGTPEIAWGDLFFYYAPDGVLPQTQPFATVVTKDYPDEPSSGLDRPGAFRVNVNAGVEEFAAQLGRRPRDPATEDRDPGARDTVIAHPVYGDLGWLAVVEPGARTEATVRELLTTAHQHARLRRDRRSDSHATDT